MASVNEELEDDIRETETSPCPFHTPLFIDWLKLIHSVGLSVLFDLIDQLIDMKALGIIDMLKWHGLNKIIL